jgi:hypothetical protein
VDQGQTVDGAPAVVQQRQVVGVDAPVAAWASCGLRIGSEGRCGPSGQTTCLLTRNGRWYRLCAAGGAFATLWSNDRSITDTLVRSQDLPPRSTARRRRGASKLRLRPQSQPPRLFPRHRSRHVEFVAAHEPIPEERAIADFGKFEMNMIGHADGRFTGVLGPVSIHSPTSGHRRFVPASLVQLGGRGSCPPRYCPDLRQG